MGIRDVLELVAGVVVSGIAVCCIPATFLSGFAEPDDGDAGPLEDGHGADGQEQSCNADTF